jgi:voltage-gated potassium channel
MKSTDTKRKIVHIRRKVRHRSPLYYAFLAIVGFIIFGTLGFHFIEGLSIIDSLYHTTQTVTTVGYGDIPPRTTSGKIFTVIFMLTGVGVVLYALTSSVQLIIQSEIIAAFGKRRKVKEMSKLENHFIICGVGRVGSRIIRELEREGVQFVVIEKNPEKVKRLIDNNEYVILSDATLEENLKQAGVERARGLAACLPDDADNVYVVLTARDINKNLHIVARAVEEQAESKLIRAGASRVVAPTIIGSHRMAQALLKPAVADFMDSITAESLDLGFEQVEIADDSIYVDKEIKDTNIRNAHDVVIVAIRRQKGEMIFHPKGNTTLRAGDLLIVIGKPEPLAELSANAKGKR